jgi:hypothetical protein
VFVDWLRRFVTFFRPPMEGIGKFFKRPRVAEPARPGVSPGDSGLAQGKQGGAVVDGTPAVGRAPTDPSNPADWRVVETPAPTGRPDESTSGELARGTDSPRRPDTLRIGDDVYKIDGEYREQESDTATPQEQPAPRPNRRARRRIDALERARLKLDRWVEPKGELPDPKPRGTIERKDDDPAPASTTTSLPTHQGPGDEGEVLWHDKIDGQDVLFLERENYGVFHFRDTVLDQLELYWTYLRRMQKRDSDAYAIYRRLGATILPPAAWFLHDGPRTSNKDKPSTEHRRKDELTAWWKENRPAFGCVSYGLTSRVEAYEANPIDPDFTGDGKHGTQKEYNKKIWNVWIPKFLYFNKYTHPPANIQPITGGDVYCMTVWWDRPNDKRYIAKYGDNKGGGVPQTFPVFISTDGSDVHILKQRETYRAPPKNVHNRTYHHGGKKGRKKKHAGDAMRVYNSWHFPSEFVEWATLHNADVDTFLCNLFIDTARAFEDSAYGMARVEVINGDLTAVFSLDPRRMAYFFKDRDITLNKNGRRVRIFHLVKPHTITTPTGKVIHKPFTFRGENEFEWAGYHVKITIPGRDHLILNEFDVGVSDVDSVDSEEKEGMQTMEESAELLRSWIDDGVLRYAPAKRPTK